MTAADATSAPDMRALRELLAAATPGPWEQTPDTHAGRVWVRMNHKSDLEPNTMPAVESMRKQWDWRRLFEVRSHRDAYGVTREDVYQQREADAALIVAAVNNLPLLLDALDEARAENEYLRKYAPSREMAERDAAVADAQALRERVTALVDEVDSEWLSQSPKFFADALRAALTADDKAARR